MKVGGGVWREEVNCLGKGGICDHVKIKNIKKRMCKASCLSPYSKCKMSSMSYVAESFDQCPYMCVCVRLW